MRFFTTLLVLVALLTLAGGKARAQGEMRSISFTGYLIGGKNNEPLVGATVYIPKAARGDIADRNGFFSLQVYPGDSVVFRYVGYKEQYHVIPRTNEPLYSGIIEMQEQTTLLREVKVYPYPTEDEFKKAFLDARLPDEKQREALAKNTDAQYLRQLGAIMGAGASANYRYFLNQQVNYNVNKNFATTIPFLNPFAWASFVKAVKNGEFKRDDWKPAANMMPSQNIDRDRYIRQQSK